MRFPKDTLLRLLGHGRSIVAANYPTRQPPIIPIALDVDKMRLFEHPTEPLHQVHAAPMGCMLTALDVFLEMQKPWFALGYNKDQDDYAPEDMFFCQKARELGYSILVDTRLSEEVRHVGTMEFDMGHARQTLAAIQSQEQPA
jgi:hypothetical protein